MMPRHPARAGRRRSLDSTNICSYTLRVVSALLADLPGAGLDLAAMGDQLLDEHVHALLQRKAVIDAAVLDAIAAWDARSVWKTSQGTSPRNALMAEAAMTPADAKATVTAARNLAATDTVAAALRTGRIGAGHARVIAAFAQRPRIRDQFDDVAEQILTDAALLTIEVLPLYLRMWEQRLDPDGAEPAERAQQSLRLTDRGDRLDLLGRLYGQDRVLVRNAIRVEVEGLRELAQALPAAERPTDGQLHADALVNLIRRATTRRLDDDWIPARPLVTVSVDLATLEQRAGRIATLAQTTVIGSDTLRALACDADIAAVLVDSLGTPVQFGTTLRLADPDLRRACAERDKECRFPGCHNPISDCVYHHIRFWTDTDAETTLDNGAMVCEHHHRMIHGGGWTLQRLDTGHLLFTSPTGEEHLEPEATPHLDGPPPAPDDDVLTPKRARRLVIERLIREGLLDRDPDDAFAA
jgi:hypothetical protein